MDEPAQGAGRRHPLEPRARLGRALSEAGHLAELEAAPDQRVQIDAARDDVAPRGPGLQLDAMFVVQRLDGLGLDQRELLATAPVGREAALPTA